MSICKYCGQESGGTPFCQNCGAKVEVQPDPIPTQPVTPFANENPQPYPQQDPYQPQQSSYGVQPPYYTPGGAGGLLAGNIISLVLGLVCCCCTNFISLIAVILGILGIVFASKVKTSMNAEEEASNRKKARIMMIVGFLVILGGLAFSIIKFFVDFNKYADGRDFKEYFESVYQSVSESLDNVTK